MDLGAVLKEWGWAGVVVYIVVERMWPTISSLWADKQEHEEKLSDGQLKLQATELANAMKEREWQHELQLRREANFEDMIKAMRDLTASINASNQSNALANERLANMALAQATHDKFTIDAVNHMADRVSELHSKKRVEVPAE
jgi:FMN phosphatase YigB (HAD superfamily)